MGQVGAGDRRTGAPCGARRLAKANYPTDPVNATRRLPAGSARLSAVRGTRVGARVFRALTVGQAGGRKPGTVGARNFRAPENSARKPNNVGFWLLFPVGL